MTVVKPNVQDEREQYAFHDDITYLRETKAGLTEATVREISETKDEPAWMLEYRLRAYKHFEARAMPHWGGDLTKLDFSKIVYYRKPSEREEKSWDDVPDQIKKTFERLGIPEAERKFLSGVGAQYDSEVVYHSVREDLQKLGVVFMGTDQGMKEYPEIFKKYFGTVVQRKTTSLRRSTPQSGRVDHLSTSRRASRCHSHSRPTSASTARTPDSLSARSLLWMRVRAFTTLRAAPRRTGRPTRFTSRS